MNLNQGRLNSKVYFKNQNKNLGLSNVWSGLINRQKSILLCQPFFLILKNGKYIRLLSMTSVYLVLTLQQIKSVTWPDIHEIKWIHQYTGCHRRKGPNFGRVFLMLNYTDITQNTYIQSWTVTEMMAREVWNFDSCYTLTDCQIHIETGRNMWFQ